MNKKTREHKYYKDYLYPVGGMQLQFSSLKSSGFSKAMGMYYFFNGNINVI